MRRKTKMMAIACGIAATYAAYRFYQPENNEHREKKVWKNPDAAEAQSCSNSLRAVPVQIGCYTYTLDGLTLSDMRNDGWKVQNKDNMNTSTPNAEYILTHDEISCPILIDCKGDTVTGISVNAIDRGDIDFSCVVFGESVRIGSSEKDLRREYGAPLDVVESERYRYKLFTYRVVDDVITFNISAESGIQYASISRACAPSP